MSKDEFDKLTAELSTPEGFAFDDYISSTNNNDYPKGTVDHQRYETAMSDLMKGSSRSE